MEELIFQDSKTNIKLFIHFFLMNLYTAKVNSCSNLMEQILCFRCLSKTLPNVHLMAYIFRHLSLVENGFGKNILYFVFGCSSSLFYSVLCFTFMRRAMHTYRSIFFNMPAQIELLYSWK